MIHKTYVNVRFGETDALGHVNNVSYFIYFEQARVEFFKSIGYKVGKNGLNFALVSTQCDYVAQAFFDQELMISTVVTKIGKKSFYLQHIINNALSQQTIAKGISTVVILNEDKDGAVPIDTELKERLLLHYKKVENEENSSKII